MFVHDFIRQHLLESVGIFDEAKMSIPPLESLKETEWSPEFESLMRNRLIMGAIRYGLLHQGQQTNLFRNIFTSLKIMIDTGHFGAVMDYMYGTEPLVLPNPKAQKE